MTSNAHRSLEQGEQRTGIAFLIDEGLIHDIEDEIIIILLNYVELYNKLFPKTLTCV